MKAVVLLMIIKLLVDQGLCGNIILPSCSKGIIKWMWTKSQGEYQFEIELCSSSCSKGTIKWMWTEGQNYDSEIELYPYNSTCYTESAVPGNTASNKIQCSHYNTTDCYTCYGNISNILETFDKCTCSQQSVTSSQECSTSTTTSAISTINPSTQDINMSTTPTQDTNKSTILAKDTQIALIALLAILAVLLAIVTAGWVCTCCWAMRKSRREEMNINSINIRYSEMQATNGNTTITQSSSNQAHNNNPNTTCLSQNQAYGAQPEKTSPDLNADRKYEVIPPLAHEKTRLNRYNTEATDYRETSNVQTGEEIVQLHQQTSPRQPIEEVEGSHMQSGQQMTENGDYNDSLIGNENVHHILEPKAEDDEDTAAPYEVPVLSKMKTKTQ